MAKDSSKGFGWKGVSTGTPCADPADNKGDYNPTSSGGDWRGERDSTPSSDGKSQSIKINGGGSDEE